MFRHSAEYWRDRADEIRAIRDCTTGEGPRRILAQIAADYLRLHDWALEWEGSYSEASDRRSDVESIFR
jgi:hypothetical protein